MLRNTLALLIKIPIDSLGSLHRAVVRFASFIVVLFDSSVRGNTFDQQEGETVMLCWYIIMHTIEIEVCRLLQSELQV